MHQHPSPRSTPVGCPALVSTLLIDTMTIDTMTINLGQRLVHCL